MADHSPGDPLYPAQLSGNQGLPANGFAIPSHVMNVGSGQYHLCTPVVIPVPLVHAGYRSHDVPFVPQRTNYKP